MAQREAILINQTPSNPGSEIVWPSHAAAEDTAQSCEPVDQILAEALRLLSLGEILAQVKQEESARISRELHDELGQILTSMKIGLSLLIRRGERELQKDAEEYIAHLRRMRNLADDAIRSVQRIIKGLRPVVLDEVGLVDAIDRMIERFRETTKIQFDFSHQLTDDSFEHDFATAVYRIVQESLTNVARHSHASHVNIQMREVNSQLEVMIEDNGVGIDLKQVSLESMGLLGMRERAKICGGEVAITSRPSIGTKVMLFLPFV